MTGLYNGVAGLSGSSGLWGNVAGLWSGATGLQDGSGGPALSLNFLSGTLDSRVTFTRSSTATFVGSNGFIQTAAINTPRFDYDPVTLEAEGLLIEEARTNLVRYSQAFNETSVWAYGTNSITPDTVASPDGNTNADTFTATSTGVGFARQTITIAASATYTATCFFKKGSVNFANITCISGSDGNRYWFNLNSGAVASTAVVGAGYTNVSAKIETYGDGWYRCSMTFTNTANTSLNLFVLFTDADASLTLTSGNTGYLWGAQLEAGAFPTSYIPTVASQVTRTADVPSMTGTNFSSWYAGPQGTFVCGFTANNPAVSSRALWVADNSTGRILDVYISGIAPNRVDVYSNHTLSGLYGLGTFPTPNTIIKVAATMGENDSAAVANGGAVVVDNITGVPLTATRLIMGQYNSVSYLNGHIRSVTYYNSRLTNAQLQALSTP